MPFSEHYQKKMVRLQDQLGLTQQGDNEAKYFLQTAFHMLNFHPEQAAALLQGTPLLQVCGDQDECATREQLEEISEFASSENEIRWIAGGTDHLDLHVNPDRDKQLGFAADWFECYIRQD